MAPEQVSSESLCDGELLTFRWYDDRMVRAWLPPGYEKGAKEALPCMWLNDGQNVFRDEVAFGGVSWGAAGTVLHLIRTGCIPRLAIIAIDHAGAQRPFDYLPEPPGNWGGMRNDMGDAPGGGVVAYTERVLNELVPWAESFFGLSTSPKDRAFGGSSFGGVSALYMAELHPEAFHGVVVESPSFWACNGRLMRDVAAQSSWPQRIYLAMGGSEYTGTRGHSEAGAKCDSFLADALAECAALLQKQGLDGCRLDWHVEPNAGHTEHSWRRRFPRALRWLWGTPAPAFVVPGASFWSRPSPIQPGKPFELYADPRQLKLPMEGGAPQIQARLGFDNWSRGQQDVPLLPAGLPKDGSQEVDWLAGLAFAPEGAHKLSFAITDGKAWDNNNGQDYELPVAV